VATTIAEKTLVRYEKQGQIAVVTLDDPPANTYTHEMMRQLDEAILDARFDGDVEVIVLTGAGEKFFSAGANINMLNSVTPEFKYMFCLHANETLSRLEQTPKLVIAALNGHCVGGGMEIAMAADIRIARAGRNELDDLVPQFDGYRQFYGQRSDRAAARAFLSERIEHDESVIYMAYTEPREAVGFTQLYPSFSSVSLKPLWILNDLYVRPDIRRGGVGRALLERARQHAVDTGAKGLILSTAVTNEPAQTLYESCGWKRDDEFLHYHLFF